MTNYEVEALNQFRAGMTPPSEELEDRILAHAYRAQPGREGTSRERLLPTRSGKLLVALATVAIAVTGGIAASGAFTNAEHHSAAPARVWPINGDQTSGGLDVNYVHNGASLSSIAVTLNPNVANASVQIEIVHTNATSADAYAGKAQTQVVFQKDVSTSAVASSANESGWSGTLNPSLWTGGCQSGLYQIQYLAIPPGRTFANATAQPGSEYGASEWFSCGG